MSKIIQIDFSARDGRYALCDDGIILYWDTDLDQWVESEYNSQSFLTPEANRKRKKLVECWTAYVGFQHGLPEWGLIGNSSHEVKELILDRFTQRNWTLALSDGWSIEQIEMRKVDDE